MFEKTRARVTEKCKTDLLTRQQATEMIRRIIYRTIVQKVRPHLNPMAHLIQFIRDDAGRNAVDQALGRNAHRDETIPKERSLKEMIEGSPDHLIARMLGEIADCIDKSATLSIEDLTKALQAIVARYYHGYSDLFNAEELLRAYGVRKILDDMIIRETIEGKPLPTLLIVGYVRETASEFLGCLPKKS